MNICVCWKQVAAAETVAAAAAPVEVAGVHRGRRAQRHLAAAVAALPSYEELLRAKRRNADPLLAAHNP
jgi:hypothetical protein